MLSEVRKLLVHPTWFIGYEDFMANFFHKIKQFVLLLFMCAVHI